jgi:hypothetical protein
MRKALLIVIGTMAVTACGPILKGSVIKSKVTTLPPPAQPRHENATPPYYPKADEGEGILVVNVPAIPEAKVSLVTSSRASALEISGKTASSSATKFVDQETKLLCSRAPCAVKLPLGSHAIVIEGVEAGWESRRDNFNIDIVPSDLEMTHTLSRRSAVSKPPKVMGGILLETLGWCLAALAPMPLLLYAPEVGVGMLGGGLLMIYLGYKMYSPGLEDVTYRSPATTVHPHTRR